MYVFRNILTQEDTLTTIKEKEAINLQGEGDAWADERQKGRRKTI